jgi:hypothetical protein
VFISKTGTTYKLYLILLLVSLVFLIVGFIIWPLLFVWLGLQITSTVFASINKSTIKNNVMHYPAC